MEDKDSVLEWLLDFRDTADDDDDDEKDDAVIEEVSASNLESLIVNSDNLAVLFCKYRLCYFDKSKLFSAENAER